MRSRVISAWSLAVLLACLPAFAQSPEDEDLPPGVYLKLTAGDKTVERIEDDISAKWGEFSPDSRLPAGPFRAEWKSQILLREAGEYRIWAWGTGKVSVKVDGKEVLQGEADEAKWIEGSPFDVGFGLKPLEVSYEKTSDNAELHLYWSNEPSFPLEPIPTQVLFRDGGRPDLALIEQGRQLFEAHRCVACHRRTGDAQPTSAPDLVRWTAGLESAATLTVKLAGHGGGMMPSFGLNGAENQQLRKFLIESAEEQKLEAFPKPGKGRDDAQDRASGMTLLKSTGCLACHRVNGEGIANPHGGADLSSVGFKRSREWCFTWLKDPAKLNPQHRMPVFSLSTQERRQLALALVSLRKSKPNIKLTDVGAPSPSALEIIQSARCAACHTVPGAKKVGPPDLSGIPTLEKPVSNWEKSCVGDDPVTPKWRPVFPVENRKALRTYVESFTGAHSKQSPYERGRELFVSLNCKSCHPRHTGKGLAAIAKDLSDSDTGLRGQAPSLVPPSLTAVGDKLLDEALAKAVSGEQKQRMDWIHARMPKFKHAKSDRDALIAYFVGHDRIPANAPTWNIAKKPGRVVDKTVALGQDLTGPKGFSCISCHQAGSYVPKKAAMGARGSDIVGLGTRMRHEYFIRWTRSPLRVVPGTEMPSYIKPVKHVLDENIDRQLETLWRALNSEKYLPPTNPSAVEQLITVEAGAPPRIIRDVFTNPEANGGGYVARAFAIGFENQHSVLIDLDTLTLRSWNFGDFARQRTSGKSWYWDMAGSPMITGISPKSDYALITKVVNGKPGKASDRKTIEPLVENGTAGRLVDYSSDVDGVRFRYRLNFLVDGKKRTLDIDEHLKAMRRFDISKNSGVLREIKVRGIPDGWDLRLSYPNPSGKPTFGSPHTGRYDRDGYNWTPEGEHGTPFGRWFSRVSHEDGFARCVLRYTSTLESAPLTANLKPPEKPQATPVNSMPGYDGVTLPLPGSIMPTAMTFLKDGTLAFTSLKGHVYLARDTNGDGLQDSLQMFEEGLAAPYGIIEDGDSIIVSQKPELTRLRDTDGDGRADQRSVFATGWGFNDNYHDWSCGIVRDSKGNMYVGLGSNYGQPKRAKEYSLWRGSVVKVSPEGKVTPFSSAFRYPTGLAIDSQDRLFASDNQGVQNCFNEINHLREGLHFGVPNYHDRDLKVDPHPPAVQVPHPWVRSVNGIQILPDNYKVKPLAGHGIGAEYEEKLLVRFTYHEVDGDLQGAVYYLSKPKWKLDETFLGPLCVTTAPNGDIYVGSIHDSGWLGGLNTGSIVRLRPNGKLPNGIREIRATSDGFEIRFHKAIDQAAAAKPENYSISGYTRVWGGSYATPDSGRYQANIESVKVADDVTFVRIKVDQLKAGYVYDVNCQLKDNGNSLWPATGHYSMTKVPK
jgi:mono/diheme cytochrome c family protein